MDMTTMLTPKRLADPAWTRLIGPALVAGSLANAVSATVLAWRGRRDTGSVAAVFNAPSHWLWGREALEARSVDAPHTALGLAVHWMSSLCWGAAYQLLRQRRRQASAANAVADAVAVTAVAAVVDLKLVPERLTPGFEHHLSNRSLWWVYTAFAVGLALGGARGSQR